MSEAALDAMVGAVWAAATGARPWEDAMAGIARQFDARLAVLHRYDLADQRALASVSGTNEDLEDGLLQYMRRFHRLDPRRAQLLSGQVVAPGGWYHDHEHLDEAFVADDPFYQHFVAAYRSRYVAARILQPADDQALIFALELPAARGPLSPDEREMVRRLGLQLDEALRSWERLRRIQAQVLAGRQLLHGLPQPLWLIDLHREVHDANAAARAEMQRGRLLVQLGVRLLPVLPRLEPALAGALHELRDAPHGSRRVLCRRLPGSDMPVWLHLCLLRPQASAGAFGGAPMVLLSLFDPAQMPDCDPAALAGLLHLTPAQARAAAALANGSTPEQIAAANGTQVTTVRSHLAAVMRRLGAQRSDDLVRQLNAGLAVWGTAARS